MRLPYVHGYYVQVDDTSRKGKSNLLALRPLPTGHSTTMWPANGVSRLSYRRQVRWPLLPQRSSACSGQAGGQGQQHLPSWTWFRGVSKAASRPNASYLARGT